MRGQRRGAKPCTSRISRYPTRSPVEERRRAQRLLSDVLADLERSGWHVEQCHPAELARRALGLRRVRPGWDVRLHHDRGGRLVGVSVPEVCGLMLSAEAVAELTLQPSRVVYLINAAVTATRLRASCSASP